MRKILFTLFAVMMTMSAMASDFKVTQGDKKLFKNAQGTAVLVFDFDGATYDDKMPLNQKDNFKDMDKIKRIAWDGFKQNFEDKNKGKITLIKDGNADYKITVKVTKMDQFFNIGGFVPATATKMFGTVTITDSNGNILAEVKVDGLDGGSNPVPDECISDCFEELGEQVAKMK